MKVPAFTFTWTRFAAGALLLYAALVALAFTEGWTRRTSAGPQGTSSFSQAEQGDVANARKNYASVKQVKASPAGQPLGDVQKYEKIASLTQRTSAFESDKTKIEVAIAGHQGIVQLERGTGLPGRRILSLGIGIPPDKFDAFIAAARAIGKTVLITTVKNDKTNDYLQLRAKRTTLEKARTALDALQGTGGSVDERIHVQNQLTEIEEKIQDLGVSLGDFDSQNELCTVKLTLEEAVPLARASVLHVLVEALARAAFVYVGIAAGFALLMAGAWAGLAVIARIRQLMAEKGA